MDFTLRPWTISDKDSLAKYANNQAIAHNLTNQFPYPYSEEDAVFFIENVTTRDDNDIMAIDIDGEAVGGIGLHFKQDVYCKNVELGYWVAEPFWGHGIMTKAIKDRVEFAFANYDIHRIYASVYTRNTGSWKALEKAGFTREAHLKESIFKDGVLEDEYIYSLRRNK